MWAKYKGTFELCACSLFPKHMCACQVKKDGLEIFRQPRKCKEVFYMYESSASYDPHMEKQAGNSPISLLVLSAVWLDFRQGSYKKGKD